MKFKTGKKWDEQLRRSGWSTLPYYLHPILRNAFPKLSCRWDNCTCAPKDAGGESSVCASWFRFHQMWKSNLNIPHYGRVNRVSKKFCFDGIWISCTRYHLTWRLWTLITFFLFRIKKSSFENMATGGIYFNNVVSKFHNINTTYMTKYFCRYKRDNYLIINSKWRASIG